MASEPASRIRLFAPAKVNLCLAVDYPPQDSFHALNSVFAALDVGDDVTIEVGQPGEVCNAGEDGERGEAGGVGGGSGGSPTGTGGVGGLGIAGAGAVTTALGTPVVLMCGAAATSTSTDAQIACRDVPLAHAGDSAGTQPSRIRSLGSFGLESLPVRDNLAFRALDAVEQACGVPAARTGQAVRIIIDKRIPVGAGLGGGSSDAAAVLRAYAQLQGLDPLDERILAVARSLGADVTFFLYGGCALMTGRGDVLVRSLPALSLPLVLMGDAGANPTGTVYAAFDDDPAPAPDTNALADAMQDEAFPAAKLAGLCANNLEAAACSINVALAERLERARADEDVLEALVSGSGSTTFALCSDEAAAQRFAKRAASWCDWVHVAHAFVPIPFSSEIAGS